MPMVRPHSGPQEMFASSPADICIGGGMRGGGKTTMLLLEPLRHITRKRGFGAVLFRRKYPEITGEGGPWQESVKLYPALGGRGAGLRWRFPPYGNQILMRHMQLAKTVEDYKGWQIPLILLDQLELFLESQFWALIATNRSTCGVRPYIRASCNPVPEDDEVGGWLRKLLDWWIDPQTGYAIPERAGRIRWFVRVDEILIWADTREELIAAHPTKIPLSLSFVPMGLEQNPSLFIGDPDYVAKLDALPYVDRMRFRYGNWNVRAQSGTVFKREWFRQFFDVAPAGPKRTVRYWDCAATSREEAAAKRREADYTAGGKVSRYANGLVLVEDITAGQWGPKEVDGMIAQCASLDGRSVWIFEEQEPGSSGKAVVTARATALQGHRYTPRPKRIDKLTFWKPFCSQAEAGNVGMLRAPWNERFIKLCELTDGIHGRDDDIDAVAGAYVEAAALPIGGGRVSGIDGYDE